MKRSRVPFLVALATACVLGPLQPVGAMPIGPLVTAEGNVTPDLLWNGSTASWNTSTVGYIGDTEDGSVTVSGGAGLVSRGAYIGTEESSTGEVTVTGSGSAWTSALGICVGSNGNGTLNIKNGALVDTGYAVLVGQNSGSIGQVTVDGAGSTLNTLQFGIGGDGVGILTIAHGGTVTVLDKLYLDERNLGAGMINFGAGGGTLSTGTLVVGPMGIVNFGAGLATLTTKWFELSAAQATGTGTINTCSLTSDFDVVFDSATGLTPTCMLNGPPGQAVTVHLDMTDPAVTKELDLGVGYKGNGSMTIRDGNDVVSANGYLGYQAGSTGSVSVEGATSTWAIDDELFVGYHGHGELHVSADASVEDASSQYPGSHIGYQPDSTGLVTIRDAAWNRAGDLHVGQWGHGTIEVANGGSLSITGAAYIGEQRGSTGSATIGENSTWTGIRNLYVGHGGSGTMNVVDGGTVSYNGSGYIGNDSQSTGMVTVDGSDSTLTANGWLYVGYYGNGTLNILDGGEVVVAATTYVANKEGSTGAVHFGLHGGKLTTAMLWAAESQLTGTGAIETRGLVSDVDLVFDAHHGPNQTFTLRRHEDQNIAITLNLSDPKKTGDLGLGYSSRGSMVIQDGVIVRAKIGYLGYAPGSEGTATISGGGSAWIPSDKTYVGYKGTGSVTITDGGHVGENNGGCYVGYGSSSHGEITISDDGSQWVGGDLFVGESGEGVLNIINGGDANASSNGRMGFNAAAAGFAKVDGEGSTWTTSRLAVGVNGTGILTITNGGVVTGTSGISIASGSGSSGVVTVSGIHSSLSNGWNSLVIGSGSGRLNIADGGAVTAAAVSLDGTKSLLSINVANDSRLTVGGGTGKITNNGAIRLAAGAAPAGVYTPISAGALTTGATGVWQTLGGVWNADSRKFTVAAAEEGKPDNHISIDLDETQRVWINDAATGRSLIAGFQAKTGSILELTTARITGNALTDLQNRLDVKDAILNGWLFTTNGAYAEGETAHLSFSIPEDFAAEDLRIWQYDGATWAPFVPADLTRAGQYASFTVTSLRGCALTAAVPEPATFTLLVSLIGLILVTRRDIILRSL